MNIYIGVEALAFMLAVILFIVQMIAQVKATNEGLLHKILLAVLAVEAFGGLFVLLLAGLRWVAAD